MAHPRGKAAAKAGRAQPGAALLPSLCAEDGVDARSDLRADEDRQVVFGADETARRV